MGAREGNTNAKKTRTRVVACLSISDEKQKRLTWVIETLRAKGNKTPTDEEVSRFIKDWCYERIDEEIAKQ